MPALCRVVHTSSFVLLAALGACAKGPAPAAAQQRDAGRVRMRQVGEVGMPGRYNVAYDVAIGGNSAFVSGNDGVMVVDISDRSRLRRVAFLPIDGGAFGVEVANGFAYIAGGRPGLVVADVRDPARPRIVGTLREGEGSQVCLSGALAFLSSDRGGFWVIDVHDPARPALVARMRAGSRGRGLGCLPRLVYYADPDSGLRVLDVSDPAAPRRVTTVPGTQGAWDIHLLDGRLYLGRHGRGVSILDLADPRSPRILGSFSDGGEAYGVSGDTSRLLVADLQRGVELLDPRAPSRPVLVVRLDEFAPHEIRSDGTHAFVADQNRGFVVFQLGDRPGLAEPSDWLSLEYRAIVGLYDGLPVYGGAREVFRHRQRPMVSQGEPHQGYLFHILEARGTLAEALRFYQRELVARGWEIMRTPAEYLQARDPERRLFLLIHPTYNFSDAFLRSRPAAGTVRYGISISPFELSPR